MQRKKFFESASFEALQTEWYQKLKDDGFQDIEGGNNTIFIEPEISTPPAILSKIQKVLEILNSKQDELRDRDIQILEMYADSKTVTEIAQHLGIKHQSVSERIRTIISRYF